MYLEEQWSTDLYMHLQAIASSAPKNRENPNQSHSHTLKKERSDNLYTTSKDRTRKNKSDEATREKVDEK